MYRVNIRNQANRAKGFDKTTYFENPFPGTPSTDMCLD